MILSAHAQLLFTETVLNGAAVAAATAVRHDWQLRLGTRMATLITINKRTLLVMMLRMSTSGSDAVCDTSDQDIVCDAPYLLQ